jgi:hypothetical protein
MLAVSCDQVPSQESEPWARFSDQKGGACGKSGLLEWAESPQYGRIS